MIDHQSANQTLSPPDSAPEKQLRSLLVMPWGTPDHRTGGGQRSLLFLQTLCTLGPTTLIYYGEEQEAPDPAQLPPGAEWDITYFAGKDTPVKQIEPKALRRLVIHSQRALERYAPWWPYRKRRNVAQGLARVIAEKKPDLVVFRYVKGMLLADHPGHADYITIVDVDDRPDSHLVASFRKRFGYFAAEILFRPFVDVTLMRRVRKCLRRADLVFYSKQDDIIDLPPATSAVRPNVPYSEAELATQATSPTLLFVGAETYAPNRRGLAWFLEHCWPEISAQHSDAQLRIVGSGNWPGFGRNYTHLDRVDFVGFAEDLAAEYAQAAATICPIFEGAGTQIKVIESCAFSKPVISSDFSAGGFGPDIEKHLIVAKDKDSFAKGCLTLLNDPAQSAQRGASLRTVQQEQFSRSAFQSGLRADILGTFNKHPASRNATEVSQ